MAATIVDPDSGMIFVVGEDNSAKAIWWATPDAAPEVLTCRMNCKERDYLTHMLAEAYSVLSDVRDAGLHTFRCSIDRFSGKAKECTCYLGSVEQWLDDHDGDEDGED